MGAITNLSDMVNRATGGNSGTPEAIWFYKDARVDGAASAAPVVGRWSSLWRYNGAPGGASAAPGAVAIPDNTTEGALKQTDPGGGRAKWGLSVQATALTPGTLLVYDRLLHIGGLSGTTTSAQAVQGGTAGSRSPALTRYTDGIGNVAWVEVYTAIGASATTILMTYDDAGNNESTGQLTPIGGTGLNEAQRMIWLPQAAGDNAIRGVKEVDLTATTSTAGNFGVTIAHPLAYLQIAGQGLLGRQNWVTGIIPEIKTDACIGLAWMADTTTVPQVWGMISMIEA